MIEYFLIAGLLALIGLIISTVSLLILVRKLKESQVALAESEERFRTLAEKSVAGVYIVQDGVFRYVNPRIAEVIGVSVNEIIGRSPLDFVYPEDRELVRENIEKRLRGEVDSVHYSLRVVTMSGEVRVVEVFGSRATIGGKPAIIGTLIDITEILRLNRLLRVINNVNKLIAREKDRNKLLDGVAKELASFEDYDGIYIGLMENGKFVPAARVNTTIGELSIDDLAEVIKKKEMLVLDGEKYPFFEGYAIAAPMVYEETVKGILLIFAKNRTLDEEEFNLIQTLASDLAFALAATELEEQKREAYEQLSENILQFAALIDEIRNPLAVLTGLVELKVEDEELLREIMEQINKIDKVCDKLEKGWVETEKVREFLEKIA